MNSVLSDRLQQARQRLFVGRTPEMKAWTQALESEHWAFPLWYIHGLGGMGKTSLLRQWRKVALEYGIQVVTLDARDFEPSGEAFCAALREVLLEIPGTVIEGESSPVNLSRVISDSLSRVVLQIDTYELLVSLDDWLRTNFFPHLPENCVVTMAGRDPLSLSWRGDAGWQELVRTFDLGELSQGESSNYLERRGVAAEAQESLLSWAHGHPLALSLSADVWLQRPSVAPFQLEKGDPDAPTELGRGQFQPGDVPQLVGSLLEHLVREVPTRAHRAALEACAIVAVMSEELLCSMLEGENAEFAPVDVHTLFEWLRRLSVIQTNRFGIFPHDLAREVLVADSRWRSPNWHNELHRKAREHYLRLIHHATGQEQQRAIFDCIFLHRMSPAVAPYLQWHDSRCTLDTARPHEIDECLSWIERFEGEASRQIAARWFALQPENLIVVREQNGAAQGLIFQLALQDASLADLGADPATRATWEYLKSHAPLRGGEKATHFRFWMDKDVYQNVGATQSLIFVQAVRHYIVTPHLAFTIFPCAERKFWQDGFLYADLHHAPEADYEVDGHQYSGFIHDWRARPVLSWFDLLSQREMQTVAIEPHPETKDAHQSEFRFLEEAEFHAAVRQALRHWSDSAALRRSPLIATALVARRARQIAAESAATVEDKELALRSLLREATATLAVAPRQDRSYRALELVFGRRTLSQENAAEAMNVSHSSFRRYLRAALQFISESLWHRETARTENEMPYTLKNAENERNMTLF